MALAAAGSARSGLAPNSRKVAQANALDGWRFTEWLHGRTLAPLGMAGQSWNAATFLLALPWRCAASAQR